MSPSPISVKVLLGESFQPAPLAIMQWLETIEVTQGETAPAGFQLGFHAPRSPRFTADNPLMASSLLQPFTRVAITAQISGGPAVVLIDGYTTHQQLQPPGPGGRPSATITGEDVSVLMDLIELSIDWPALSDAGIATAVLAKYALIGIVPDIEPTLGAMVPDVLMMTPQQNGTDRKYLQELAGAHGARFYVTPGLAPGQNTAYWGGPVRSGTPQKALSVDLGPATNVESLSFTYDALAPTLVNGFVQDSFLTDSDLPITTFGMSRTALAANNPLSVTSLHVRRSLFAHAGLDPIQAGITAQSITDQSTDAVATAEGELDTLRYGGVLQAHALVDVRGAGSTMDGTWYVRQVTHSISANKWTQRFQLAREGTGTLVSRVTP